MSISNSIAWKYFFKRKNNHFINYISGLSILGLTIGISALLLITSVFNGFEDLLMNMYSQTNADLSLSPAQGKTIELSGKELTQLGEIPEVISAAPTIHETVLFEYDNNNLVTTLYGVPENYFEVVDLRPFKSMGELDLRTDGVDRIILGSNLKINLGVVLNDPFRTLQTYFPNRDKNTFLGKKLLKKQSISPIGTYTAFKDGSANTAYAPITYVQRLVGYPDQVYSGVEFKVKPEADYKILKENIRKLLPNHEVILLDKFEQDADLYKLMNIEKWMGFALVLFTLILIAFNLIGCIWMIVIEKQDNFRILRAMGAKKSDIKKIVFKLGSLYALTSIAVGTVITLTIYFLQKTIGLVNMSEGFMVEQYPTALAWQDFALAYLAVLTICLLAAWPSAQRAVNLAYREKK
ncbi:ABC transporter permease [Membranihabitans marinus]|uniref:ABC transporter permease n=1 Tax=Membranihabitans marinus TaxID=1227546 RepID=UPI001F453D9C|nr:ABC transporter permease [Membranihabitans marinus]